MSILGEIFNMEFGLIFFIKRYHFSSVVVNADHPQNHIDEHQTYVKITNEFTASGWLSG